MDQGWLYAYEQHPRCRRASASVGSFLFGLRSCLLPAVLSGRLSLCGQSNLTFSARHAEVIGQSKKIVRGRLPCPLHAMQLRAVEAHLCQTAKKAAEYFQALLSALDKQGCLRTFGFGAFVAFVLATRDRQRFRA